MISNEPKEDAASITDELTAEQKLQMITEIDQRIEKSENRVLAAIAELKSELRSEIGAVNGRVDSLNGRVDSLNGRVDSLKTLMIYTFTGIFGVFAAFFAGYSALVVWMLNKLIA